MKVNLDKMAEVVKHFTKIDLQATLWIMIFERILDELVLVDVLRESSKDGTPTHKTETLQNFLEFIEAERMLIKALGREEAAKVYGRSEGIMSSVLTVDFILNFDFKTHYTKLIEKSHYDEGGPI